MKEIDQSKFLHAFETAFEQRVSGVTLETAFRELSEWDSLASVMIVAEIYADYGVQVSGDELGACRTVGDLKSLVQAKL